MATSKTDIYGKIDPKKRFCLWVKVVTDPFDRERGFSLLGREFVVYGSNPVKHTVMCTIDRKPMAGTFYPIHIDEWLRVVPEMMNSPNLSNFMFIPVEFAMKFVRPRYNKPTSYQQFGLENETWARKGGLTTFGKYTQVDKAIPERARQIAEQAYKSGLRADADEYERSRWRS